MGRSRGESRRLVLVKHSLPAIDEAVDSADWDLAEEGVRRCGPLAEALAAYLPAAIVSSAEPKAERTARLVSARLGASPAIVPGLHEHDRRGMPLLGHEAFEEMVARFFARPEELVYGNESASQALARFDLALDGLLERQTAENLIVVAHGTVIALFVASRAGVAAFDLWRRLWCPSFVVLSLPALLVEQVVEAVE